MKINEADTRECGYYSVFFHGVTSLDIRVVLFVLNISFADRGGDATAVQHQGEWKDPFPTLRSIVDMCQFARFQ